MSIISSWHLVITLYLVVNKSGKYHAFVVERNCYILHRFNLFVPSNYIYTFYFTEQRWNYDIFPKELMKGAWTRSEFTVAETYITRYMMAVNISVSDKKLSR